MEFRKLDLSKENNELPELEGLIKNAWRTVLENLGAYTEEYENNTGLWGREAVKRQALENGFEIMMAFDEGRLVGSFTLQPASHRGEDAVCLRRLVVEPENRKKGYGKLMVEECERICRDKGLRWLTLFTAEQMVRLVNFYENLGFKEWKRETVCPYGKEYFRVHLEKQL